MDNPLLHAIYRAGPCWLTIRPDRLTLTVPGDHPRRRALVEKALREAGVRTPDVTVLTLDGQPVLQGSYAGPLTPFDTRILGIGDTMREAGYSVSARRTSDPPSGAEPPPPREAAPLGIGQRVRVKSQQRDGTLLGDCAIDSHEERRRCDVRLDLRSRERKVHTHQGTFEKDDLVVIDDALPRLTRLRMLREQGSLSVRAAGLMDAYLRDLGLLPEEDPPLSEHGQPPLRTVLGDLWRSLRQAPPEGFAEGEIDQFFEIAAPGLAAQLIAAEEKLSPRPPAPAAPPAPALPGERPADAPGLTWLRTPYGWQPAVQELQIRFADGFADGDEVVSGDGEAWVVDDVDEESNEIVLRDGERTVRRHDLVLIADGAARSREDFSRGAFLVRVTPYALRNAPDRQARRELALKALTAALEKARSESPTVSGLCSWLDQAARDAHAGKNRPLDAWIRQQLHVPPGAAAPPLDDYLGLFHRLTPFEVARLVRESLVLVACAPKVPMPRRLSSEPRAPIGAAAPDLHCAPVAVYLGQTRGDLAGEVADLGWGEATQRGELPPRRTPWFFDNGAFRDWQSGAAFNLVQWTRDCWYIRDEIEAKRLAPPDFFVLPDRPARADSLAFSKDFLPGGLHCPYFDGKYPAPVYLVLQDGMTEADLLPVVPQIQGLFVGGSVEWKRANIKRFVDFAHAQGLKCHVGRAGGQETLQLALDAGADSIDSSLPLWSRENLARFLSALCPPVDHQAAHPGDGPSPGSAAHAAALAQLEAQGFQVSAAPAPAAEMAEPAEVAQTLAAADDLQEQLRYQRHLLRDQERRAAHMDVDRYERNDYSAAQRALAKELFGVRESFSIPSIAMRIRRLEARIAGATGGP